MKLQGLKIIVAEDNKLSQIVLKKKLESAGASVLIAEDGTEVMELLEGNAVDLVILDMYMPQMGGQETLEAIRALPDPARSQLPVIACTASMMPGEEVKVGGNDFQAVTGKPVDFDQLEGIIGGLVKQFGV